MLLSSRLLLRGLNEADLNSRYVSWLNDQEVNRFLETRFVPQTLTSIHHYWLTHRDDASSPWFAICLRCDSKHIGNIKLGPIDWIHRKADVSLFIGDKSCWGKGYGEESIRLIMSWAFNDLNLEKLTAGIYSANLASRRTFEKCGFLLEGTLRQEIFSCGKRQDIFRMGHLRSDYENHKASNC